MANHKSFKQTTLAYRLGRADPRPVVTLRNDDPEFDRHITAAESAAFHQLVNGGNAPERIHFERTTVTVSEKE